MTLFPEWQKQHENDEILSPQARTMRNRYGKGPAKAICGQCKFLTCKHFAKRYYKCTYYGDTGGSKSDWRVSWPACGLYQEKK